MKSFRLRATPRLAALLMSMGALMLMASSPAHADDKGNREHEALRRTQQSLRQTQEERDALATDKASLTQANDKLSGELKQSSAKIQGAESRAASARARVGQLEASVQAKEKALADAQTREAELQAKLTKSEAALADKTRLTDSLTAMLKQSTAEKNRLMAQNEALYDTGLSLIDLYRSDSPSAWLNRADLPLGFRGIRVENLAEAFRTKLDNARYKAAEQAASTP